MNENPRVRYPGPSLLIVLAALLSACAQGPTLGKATQLNITGSGVDDGQNAQNCAGFTLTPPQVQAFLNNAAVTTQREIHDHYDHLPCFVEGTAFFRGYPATWRIRAAGTGSVILMGGEYLPVVDSRQRYRPD